MKKKSSGGRATGSPARGAGLLALGTLLAGAAAAKAAEPSPSSSSICYECFWSYQDPKLREDLVAYYRALRPRDRLLDAERKLILARLRPQGASLAEVFDSFRSLLGRERDRLRRLLVAETVAFLAREAGRDPARFFERAAREADRAGRFSKARIYRAAAAGSFEPAFGSTLIWRRPAVPEGVSAYLLGTSAIHVRAGLRVGVQAERTVRDWLSNQLGYGFGGRPVRTEDVLPWHEGARIRELLGFADVVVVPLFGSLAARHGERWFAADETGVFRFEVLPDKIQYPTTRAAGDLALLVDTHGLSALVGPALEEKVQLVVGCADYTGKIEAAYHLARHGVDVYFPCDRFVGDLVGHDARGTLIGSAPIRPEPGGAVIGDRPVRFRVDERIVVEDTTLGGELQYYDAPARYFRRLSELVPLPLEFVSVDGAGQSGRVVRRAEEMGSTAIAVRVWTEEDYGPVKEWLSRSRAHRAVLFHTAPYAAGYRLFQEFPEQTTFGDTRPVFVSSEGAAAGRPVPPPR